jgi:hypothetical protein
MLRRHFIEGLSSGDFEPILRMLLGKPAVLWAINNVWLKAEWQAKFATRQTRHLSQHPYTDLWVDSNHCCYAVLSGRRFLDRRLAVGKAA